MRRTNFKLALEPGLEGVVRLAQLHQYAVDLVDGKRALVGPSLRDHVSTLFPSRTVEDVLDQLLGHGPPGWDLEGAERDSQTLDVRTDGHGVAFSAIVRIIEQIAPEALLHRMVFDPLPGNTNPPASRRLH